MSGVLIPSINDLRAIAGEATLAGTVVAILLAAMLSEKRMTLLAGVIGLAGVIVAWLLTTFVQSASGVAFAGMVVIDAPGTLWKQMVLAFVAGVIGIWFMSTRHALRSGEGPEFFTLLLTATAGMMLMGTTSNLLMLLLAMEIASMPSYVLAGFRKSRPRSAEAALKFVLFGGVCTAVMVYGLSLLYGTHGTLDVAAIGQQFAAGVPLTSSVAMLMILVGLAFKLSAVPLHFWCPDVFEGAHVDVAAFLSVASKGAAVVLLARLGVLLTEHSQAVTHGFSIAIGVVAVATMTVGNLGALKQTSVKRLLAYSSIAHAGYLLSALILIDQSDARTATGIYLIIYLVMNLGAFAVLAGVEKINGSDHINAFNGLARTAPVAAAAMAVCLVSMIGLPPAAGVIGKLKIMTVLAGSGGVWWVIVAAVAINSVISMAYYARLLKAMYLKPVNSADANVIRPSAWLAAVCGIVLIGMLIFFAPLEKLMAGFAEFRGQ